MADMYLVINFCIYIRFSKWRKLDIITPDWIIDTGIFFVIYTPINIFMCILW